MLADVLSELREEPTAEVARDHIELHLALLQLVDKRLRLARLLLKLAPLVDHFLELYKGKYEKLRRLPFWHLGHRRRPSDSTQ